MAVGERLWGPRPPGEALFGAWNSSQDIGGIKSVLITGGCAMWR